ncbi:MAG: FeoB-associated Cys-rich membrane protein [Firmicutes bacterium]|nr:FeoB-associated Cys-rich membrane protein [Bacillota bacterium]
MANFIISAILILLIGSAIFYIYKAKKSGKKCIGCPDSGSCSSNHGCCSCRSCGINHDK